MEYDFKKLVGRAGSLYTCTLLNSFQLGSVIFEVMEDEEDGYRSSMQEVKIVNDMAPKGELLGQIQVIDMDTTELSGYALKDSDGHVWLEFGTNHSDDYYPYFVFNWTPKPSITDIMEKIK